ncbi:ECF transporter S component [Haloimpatiens sp. FM7315]|uniref:ECF transporter S component n=1 Tax=Haloimpatiens sp. FM7315 TaxID=3298609 RepID=UPI0035A306E1
MKKTKLNTNIKISLLAVIAFLLMYIELPLPMFPSFLKIDISDLPALIGSFAFGPVAGIVVELFKNVLHGLFASQTAFIGELANFIVGAVLVFTAGSIYKKRKNKNGAILALVIGTLAMTVTAAIVNLYILLPLYEKVLNIPMAAVIGMSSKVNGKIVNMSTFILWAIVPFNLVKGVFISIITRVIYKSVSPLLHKEDMEISKDKLSKTFEN